MHTGDTPELPLSTPGPGRTRVALPFLAMGLGLLAWVASMGFAWALLVRWVCGCPR